MEIRKISSRRSRSSDSAERGHIVLQRTTKICSKIYNALAQLLFCSFNLLLGDVFVAVVVVVCLSSFFSPAEGRLATSCKLNVSRKTITQFPRHVPKGGRTFPVLHRLTGMLVKQVLRELSCDTLALNWIESEMSFALDGDFRKRFTQRPVLVQPDAKESAVKIFFW